MCVCVRWIGVNCRMISRMMIARFRAIKEGKMDFNCTGCIVVLWVSFF